VAYRDPDAKRRSTCYALVVSRAGRVLPRVSLDRDYTICRRARRETLGWVSANVFRSRERFSPNPEFSFWMIRRSLPASTPCIPKQMIPEALSYLMLGTHYIRHRTSLSTILEPTKPCGRTKGASRVHGITNELSRTQDLLRRSTQNTGPVNNLIRWRRARRYSRTFPRDSSNGKVEVRRTMRSRTPAIGAWRVSFSVTCSTKNKSSSFSHTAEGFASSRPTGVRSKTGARPVEKLGREPFR
jgi:hypothetical protein